ncbi:response regulator [Paenibacillus sp. sgz302251]|uniref:response regulator n=1 Tax=Paenibacillus sp. sgz302251 TaxID=3414493 RepID=UPI003C7CE678
MQGKILVIEDEQKISRLLQLELTYEGYLVEIADNGEDGLDKAIQSEWDVIILDIMLPQMSGIEVLRRFRKTSRQTPVIMLTARNSIPDKVGGLDQGANDYITKPFAIEELMARIRACMRLRDEEPEEEVVQIEDLVIDTITREITRGGERIELTPKEYNLLLYLLENRNSVLEREQIINRVWGYDFLGDTNIVDVYIRYLRKKIDSNHSHKLIHTIRGVGYSLKGQLQ